MGQRWVQEVKYLLTARICVSKTLKQLISNIKTNVRVELHLMKVDERFIAPFPMMK